MDNFSVVGEVDVVAAGIKNIAASIRNKAKARKAKKISDRGGYMTLSPFQKSLIDVPDYILAQTQGTTATAKDIQDMPAVNDFGQMIKNNLTAILGFIAVIVIVYFLVKRK
jgi:hypothetical protein